VKKVKEDMQADRKTGMSLNKREQYKC